MAVGGFPWRHGNELEDGTEGVQDEDRRNFAPEVFACL